MDSRKLYMDAALLFDLAEEPANSDSLLGISSEQNISIVLSLPQSIPITRWQGCSSQSLERLRFVGCSQTSFG